MQKAVHNIEFVKHFVMQSIPKTNEPLTSSVL